VHSVRVDRSCVRYLAGHVQVEWGNQLMMSWWMVLGEVVSTVLFANAQKRLIGNGKFYLWSSVTSCQMPSNVLGLRLVQKECRAWRSNSWHRILPRRKHL